ncbi:MAG: cell envelope integrity protein TolA [Syntrophales bacterium]|nr:cell envelope integrity protein TolA [Syntrophales bacterium]
MSIKVVLATLMALLHCSLSSAQMYDSVESRRQKAEALKQAEELVRQNQKSDLQGSILWQKEADAKEFVGKRFWYVPNPSADNRIRFYETIPPSSYSEDPNLLFTPLSTTSFVVTGVVMAPPLVYPVGEDEYLLEISFPDSKVGYVNVVGWSGLSSNLYKGHRERKREYVSIESPEEIAAKENSEREKAALKERALREKERALREEEAKERAKLQAEQKRKEEARKKAIAVQEAKPEPRIGMTKNQVIHESRWGTPHDVNRTKTVNGTREQWVYGIRRYLYFDNGVLTAIQD